VQFSESFLSDFYDLCFHSALIQAEELHFILIMAFKRLKVVRLHQVVSL